MTGTGDRAGIIVGDCVEVGLAWFYLVVVSGPCYRVVSVGLSVAGSNCFELGYSLDSGWVVRLAAVMLDLVVDRRLDLGCRLIVDLLQSLAD